MTPGDRPDARDSTRADVLVSRIIDAVGAGRTASARADALRLQTAWPEVDAWCTWVIAGCSALEGDVRAASALLGGIAASGGWLGEPLLQDSALDAVWSASGGQDLRKSLQEGGRTAVLPEPCTPVQEVRHPRAVVVTIHGNGPLPPAAQRALWSDVTGVSVYALRSDVVVAPEVPVWTDRTVARRRLAAAVDEIRTREHGAPVTVVGLGSGATIALEAAGHAVPGVDRFVAVAPGRPPAAHGGSGRYELVVVLDQDEQDVAAAFRAWCGPGDALRLDLFDGLGHAYPASFTDYFSALLLDGASAGGQRLSASRSTRPSLPDGAA